MINPSWLEDSTLADEETKDQLPMCDCYLAWIVDGNPTPTYDTTYY